MILTKTYKLYNNDAYRKRFDKQIGICRFVYNLAKESKEENLKQGKFLSNFDLQKQLTECKKANKFLYNVGANSLIEIMDRLDNAYKKQYSDNKKGITANLKAKYIAKKTQSGQEINWKKYHNIGRVKWAKKEEFNTIGFKGLTKTDNGFYLPGFGNVKVFNNKQEINGIIKTARLTKKADGLHLSVSVEVADSINKNENQVGIDMGISYFLTTSKGEFVENPKHLFEKLSYLKTQSRRLSRMKRGGTNYQKQKTKLAKIHLEVSNKRIDFLQKESTKLTNKYGTIVREDLNIVGMSKNSRLSKHILDCSWGKFFNLLEYKANVIKVNPKYTSQKCNKCEHTEKENRRTQSIFECKSCGHLTNADLNASKNILKLGHQQMYENVSVSYA